MGLVQSLDREEANLQVGNTSTMIIEADQEDTDVEGAKLKVGCCPSSKPVICGCCRRTCPGPPSWLTTGLVWAHVNLTKYFTYPLLFLFLYTAILALNYDLVKLPECRHQTMPNLLATLSSINDSDGNGNGSAELETLIECRGGEVLSVLLYYCCGFAIGELFELMHLPGLVGMLGSGLLLRNIGSLLVSETVYRHDDAPAGFNLSNATTTCLTEPPVFDIDDPLVRLAGLTVVEHSISGSLRQIALMTILIRAGLGLDPKALRRLLGGVVRLTVIPCVTEAVVLMLVTHFLIGWPLAWGAVQGFICAAVSPAILVPSVIRLQAEGWGVAKGIPTLLVASSSLDDVVAITSFSVALSFAVATGESVIRMVISAPAEALGGVAVGLLSGCLLFLVPTADMKHDFLLRSLLFVCITVTLLVGSVAVKASGAGALACIAVSFTLASGLKAGLPWSLKESYDRHSRQKDKSPAPVADDRSSGDVIAGFQDKLLAKRVAAHIIHMELKDREPTLNDLEETSKASLDGIRSNRELHSPMKEEGDNANPTSTPRQRQQPTATESGMQCLSKLRDGGAVAWLFIQPLLFTLIGAEVNLKAIDTTVILFGVLSLLAGLTARTLATILAVLPNDFNMRERLFVAISWLPKATVQAALGAVALDTARQTNAPPQLISWGSTVLTIAVLSIVMTAPLGAVLIHMTAPHLLTRDLPSDEEEEVGTGSSTPPRQENRSSHQFPPTSPAACDNNPHNDPDCQIPSTNVRVDI